MLLRFLPLIFLLVFANASAQSAKIEITTPVFDPTILAAMDYAASIWEQHLVSSVPIKVNALLFPVSGAFLGFTFPNGRKDFPGAPLSDTWYPSCLANALSGLELNPGESDMDIVMAADVNWYFGTDGQPGPGQYDFVSVFLHEIGHGLGIASLSDSQGSQGSFGMIDFSQFAPFTPTFPIPMLDGYPSAYDRLLINGAGHSLTNTGLFPNPSGTLLNAFTNNNLFYAGSEGGAANGGQPPKIYAPPVFTFGVSVTHLDENAYPHSSGNSLMTPFSGLGQAEHSPGPIVLGILHDIGWGQVSAIGEAGTAPFDIQIWGGHVRVDLPHTGPLELALTDAMGRTVFSRRYADMPAGVQYISLAEAAAGLPPGFYVAQARWKGATAAKSLVLTTQ